MSQQIHSPFSDPHSVSCRLVDKHKEDRLAFTSPLKKYTPHGYTKICYVGGTVLCWLLVSGKALFPAPHFCSSAHHLLFSLVFVCAIATLLFCTCKVLAQGKAQTFTARSYKSSPFWNIIVFYAVVCFIGVMSAQANAQEVWTLRTAAEDKNWKAVTYGNNTFVAVSDSGVMTSPDGYWDVKGPKSTLPGPPLAQPTLQSPPVPNRDEEDFKAPPPGRFPNV